MSSRRLFSIAQFILAALFRGAATVLGTLVLQVSSFAQTNSSIDLSNQAAAENMAVMQRVHALRAECIAQRRMICGKILKVLPEGIVVDSGYTNLMRPALNHSWLISGTTVAERATNLVESAEPDSVCMGQVFLTELPKVPAGRELKRFDFVVLEGFPMGTCTYASVGTVQHTVRKFSTKLTSAVRWKYGAEVEEQEKAKTIRTSP